MNHLLKYFLIAFIFTVPSYSQIFQKEYETANDSLIKEKYLNLHLLGATFFNNNEFFNPYQSGYTLIGGFFQPKLVYTVNPRLILSAGVHLKKYYGDEGFANAEPIFSINFKASEALNILMGSFDGGQNHLLPETIFSFEDHFSNLTENGILISFKKEFLDSRLWLDWERFIEPGDPFREEFTAGIVNHIRLLNTNNNFRLEIPVYVLAHHAGGQINDNNQPVQSLFNFCGGIKVYKPGINGNNSIYPYAELLLHKSSGDFIITPGNAIQFTAGLTAFDFELNAGYFKGNDFISFRGLPLYHSYSENTLSGFTLGGKNDIFSFKAGYRARINETSFMFLRFEGYYNPAFKKIDYTYGLHLQVNEVIRIAKLSKRTNATD